MIEKSQEYLRLALAAAALMIGLSVAYHYMIYIPQKDHEAELQAQTKAQLALTQANEKQEAAEKSALNRRSNYRVCLSNALADYHSRWESSCKTRSEQADKNRAQCIQAGGSEVGCQTSYPEVPAANCTLPSAMANDYDTSLKNDQKQCLDEANAGVLDSTG